MRGRSHVVLALLAVPGALGWTACSSPRGAQPSASPAAVRLPSVLPPPKDHPPPPPLRWEVSLADVTLARYQSLGPVASPAVTSDGTLLVGTRGTVAVGLDGAIKWRHTKTAGNRRGHPIVSGETLGALEVTGWLHLLDPQGHELAAIGGAEGSHSPALGHEGVFYVPGATALWAFSSSAGGLRSLWLFQTDWKARWFGVSVGADGTIYGATDDGTLWAVRRDGTVRWSVPLDRGLRPSAPAIAADGTLYVGGKEVRAISAAGEVLWSYAAGGPVVAPPVIGPDGTIYVGSDDQRLHALTPLGAPRWTFETGAAIRSAAAVARDGSVYFGSNDGRLYALRPDGREKWSLATGGAVFSPTLLIDGTVVFESGDGTMRAIRDPGNGGLATAPWPKWACDLANTSRAPRPVPRGP